MTSRFDDDVRHQLLQNIVLAGGGSQLGGLTLAVERGLTDHESTGRATVNVTKVADSVFAGAAGSLKLAMDLPAEQWERLRASQQKSAA